MSDIKSNDTIANKNIEKANKLLALTNPFFEKTDIFLNPHKTVVIEWVKNNEKLSLEIGMNSYSYFIIYNNKEPKLVDEKRDVLLDVDKILQDLKNLGEF